MSKQARATNDKSGIMEHAAFKNPNTTKPPYYHPQTKNYQEEVGRFGHRLFLRPTLGVIRFCDIHNGIVTAAATLVLAVFTFFLANDSARQADSSVGQLAAIQGQLKEMRDQRLITTAQLRARLRLEKPAMHPVTADHKLITTPGQQIGGWDVNPYWTNVGITDARNVISWWEIKITPHVKSIIDCPKAVKPNVDFIKTIVNRDGTLVEMAKFLSLDDINKLRLGDSAAIFLIGRAEYNDIFKTDHYFDWCLVAMPADLASSTFSFLRVREETDD